jgi:hypothetical protein
MVRPSQWDGPASNWVFGSIEATAGCAAVDVKAVGERRRRKSQIIVENTVVLRKVSALF